MKMEICSRMVVVRGISYNKLRECWLSGMYSSRVSVFKFLTCDVKGMSHILHCGYHHSFNTDSLDTRIVVVLSSYMFTSFQS